MFLPCDYSCLHEGSVFDRIIKSGSLLLSSSFCLTRCSDVIVYCHTDLHLQNLTLTKLMKALMWLCHSSFAQFAPMCGLKT